MIGLIAVAAVAGIVAGAGIHAGILEKKHYVSPKSHDQEDEEMEVDDLDLDLDDGPTTPIKESDPKEEEPEPEPDKDPDIIIPKVIRFSNKIQDLKSVPETYKVPWNMKIDNKVVALVGELFEKDGVQVFECPVVVLPASLINAIDWILSNTIDKFVDPAGITDQEFRNDLLGMHVAMVSTDGGETWEITSVESDLFFDPLFDIMHNDDSCMAKRAYLTIRENPCGKMEALQEEPLPVLAREVDFSLGVQKDAALKKERGLILPKFKSRAKNGFEIKSCYPVEDLGYLTLSSNLPKSVASFIDDLVGTFRAYGNFVALNKQNEDSIFFVNGVSVASIDNYTEDKEKFNVTGLYLPVMLKLANPISPEEKDLYDEFREETDCDKYIPVSKMVSNGAYIKHCLNEFNKLYETDHYLKGDSGDAKSDIFGDVDDVLVMIDSDVPDFSTMLIPFNIPRLIDIQW